MLYWLMFEGVTPPTDTIPVTTPCCSDETPTLVSVVVKVVVETNVEVTGLEDPTKYPAPAPARIAMTNKATTVQLFMCQRAIQWGYSSNHENGILKPVVIAVHVSQGWESRSWTGTACVLSIMRIAYSA